MEGSDSLIYIRFRLSVYRLGLDLEPDDFFGERNAILADCQKLALMARFYAHPEVSVITTDPFATSCCYFDRPSAPKVESVEDMEGRAQILADMGTLKKLVRDYMHPELPVTVSDPSAMARCYFDRPSAPQVESVEEMETRAQILSETSALKSLARDYMHPELPVSVTDPSATARCYFDRPSAPDVEAVEDTEIRAQVLADTVAIKKSVMDYLHPELPVSVTDPTATARCHFDRPSAPEVESVDAEIRAQVLADAIAFKKFVVDYLHPELPVTVTDPSATARCYFDRPSAPEVECVEDAEIRAEVLADMVMMKKAAVDYMHPEIPVVITDPFATARCYFERHSAPEVESFEEAEYRTQVLADMISLKKLAADYMHPELPAAVTDPFATARCYFDRHSADVSTFISHVSVMSTEEVVRARSDTEQFDLEDDVFHDMKNKFTRFSRAHSFGVEEESKVIDKEEEGHLSRSPSSVMLFDMVGDRAY